MRFLVEKTTRMKENFLGKNWIKTGLIFGFLMFLIVGVGYTLLQGKVLSFQLIMVNFVVNMIGGLLYGFLMKLYFILISKKK